MAAAPAEVPDGMVGLAKPMVAVAVGTPFTIAQVTPIGLVAHVVAALAAPWGAQVPGTHGVHDANTPLDSVAANPGLHTAQVKVGIVG